MDDFIDHYLLQSSEVIRGHIPIYKNIKTREISHLSEIPEDHTLSNVLYLHGSKKAMKELGDQLIPFQDMQDIRMLATHEKSLDTGLDRYQKDLIIESRKTEEYFGIRGLYILIKSKFDKRFSILSLINLKFWESPTLVICPLRSIKRWIDTLKEKFGSSFPYFVLHEKHNEEYTEKKRTFDSESFNKFKVIFINYKNIVRHLDDGVRCYKYKSEVYNKTEIVEIMRTEERNIDIKVVKNTTLESNNPWSLHRIKFDKIIFDTSENISKISQKYIACTALYADSYFCITKKDMIKDEESMYYQFSAMGLSITCDEFKSSHKDIIQKKLIVPGRELLEEKLLRSIEVKKEKIPKYEKEDYLKGICESFVGQKVKSVAKFMDTEVEIMNCNIVGSLLESIFSVIFEKRKVGVKPGPKQQPPDFWTPDRKFYYELKVFKSPGFDISRFASYINKLTVEDGVYTQLFRTKYLLFQYEMEGSIIKIKNFNFLSVWNLIGYTGKHPISIQLRQKAWVNIRPSGMRTWDDKTKTSDRFIKHIIKAIELFPGEMPDKNEKIENIREQYKTLRAKYEFQ